MNNKIIGFTISPVEINHFDVDIFESNLSRKTFQLAGYFIYFWGIGNLEMCYINKNSCSLSFPLISSLEDRNVIINFKYDYIEIENDWLGSIPIFYSSKTLVVSTLMNKVIPKDVIDLDSEGFNNYLDFGYSVFEKTPIEGVKFLRYYSKIILTKSGLKIIYKDDILEERYFSNEIKTQPNEVLIEIKKYVAQGETATSGEIIIPTSGGFDSRLLNIAVDKKERIRAFTYGLSNDQSKSFEVVKAKKMAEMLGVSWKQIVLGEFHKYFKLWHKLFGCSTHLHGMYHIEFYQKIKSLGLTSASLLSGIVGDAWSGKVGFLKISSYQDLPILAYSHGMNSTSKYSKLVSNSESAIKFFDDNKTKFSDPNYNVITAIRFKIVLLSYLMSVPDYFGWPSWTPFLKMDIVLKMLRLPLEEKKNRKWQTNFFKFHNLDLENMSIDFDLTNTLNYQALKKIPLQWMNNSLLSKYIDGKRLNNLCSAYNKLIKNENNYKTILDKIMDLKYLSSFFRIFGLKGKSIIELYFEFLTLKSVELTLNGENDKLNYQYYE